MKIKSMIMILAVLLSLAVGITSFFLNKKNKVASIDIAKVLKSFNGVKESGKDIENKKRILQLKLDTLANEFQEALKEFEKKRGSMSNEQVNAEEQSLKRKQDEYSLFSSSNQETIKKEEINIINGALETINREIEKYARLKGYDAILAVTPNGNVIYASERIDITDEIIHEVLN